MEAHIDTDLTTTIGLEAFYKSQKALKDEEQVAVYSFAHVATIHKQLEVFFWFKRTTISIFLDSVCLNVKRENWLPTFGACRSIIEIIGMVVLAKNETLAAEAIFRKRVEEATQDNTPEDRKNFSERSQYAGKYSRNDKFAFADFSKFSPIWLAREIIYIQNRRLGQMHLDYSHYLNNSLKTNKEKHLKTKRNQLDLNSRDLMLGIKTLNKKCKGAKRVYDFASEFVHPNSLTFALYLTELGAIPGHADRVLFRKLESGIDFSNLYYGKELEKRCREVLEVIGECLDAYLDSEKQLDKFVRKLAVVIKKEIRRENRLYEKKYGSGLLKRSDLCPCYSGKVFGDCCGK